MDLREALEQALKEAKNPTPKPPQPMIVSPAMYEWFKKREEARRAEHRQPRR